MKRFALGSVSCLGLLLGATAWAMSDPMVLHPTDDTYLTVGHTGLPGGRATRDEVQIYGKPNGKQFRALLKFDVSKIKVAPTQAILRLYAWNVLRPKSTELIRCHRVVRDWSEKFASWDMCNKEDYWANLGGDWDARAIAGCNVVTTMGGQKGFWLDFDVTPIVQMWVAKRMPNYGFILMLEEGSGSELRIRSKDNATNKPELKLGWRAKLERGGGMVPGHKIKPYGKPVKLEPVWAQKTLNMVKVGQEFTQKLKVRAGAKPYKFSARGLPEGVTLSETGELAGTPTKDGRFPITFTVTGADRKRAIQRMDLVVQKKGAPDLPVADKKGDKKDPVKPDKPRPPADEDEEE